jgi:hypothetical protein
MVSPARPLGVVMGGAKVKDKISVLRSLIARADVIAVGGRMAFTFLAARGVNVGATQIEADWVEVGGARWGVGAGCRRTLRAGVGLGAYRGCSRRGCRHTTGRPRCTPSAAPHRPPTNTRTLRAACAADD